MQGITLACPMMTVLCLVTYAKRYSKPPLNIQCVSPSLHLHSTNRVVRCVGPLPPAKLYPKPFAWLAKYLSLPSPDSN